MTTALQYIRHLFGGGWATDFGPTTDIVPQANTILIPWLMQAENIIYELDGGPRKAPGTARLNSSALESGAVVKGLYDYWISGTGGTSAQHRIAHVGTTIKKDDADGTFTDLFTGLTADAVPSYAVLEDLLVMAQDSADVPKSWDGVTAQDLAGTPPNFSIVEEHKNRLWAAGNPALPSRLNYSALLAPADWIGSGSGNIDISPSDGDRIMAIASHKNELWIFKGPYKGSIHRITGSAPTGTDPFARQTFIRGLGAVGHNTVFRYRDDLGFMWADGTIHSLNATAAFGDFREAALSRPIHKYIRERFNFGRLKHAWSVNWSDRGLVLFTVPVDGGTNNTVVLVMDYRFEPVRWASWPAFAAGGLAQVIDPTDNDRLTVFSGGNDGFIRKFGQPSRSIDGLTAIAYDVLTPHFTYGTPIQKKTLFHGSVGIQPLNNGDITFGWQRDDMAQQTKTVGQGGTGVLGPAAANQFTLGTSTLGGTRFVDRFFDLEEGGEFRSVQFQLTDSVNSQDLEVHSLSVSVKGGAWSLEN